MLRFQSLSVDLISNTPITYLSIQHLIIQILLSMLWILSREWNIFCWKVTNISHCIITQINYTQRMTNYMVKSLWYSWRWLMFSGQFFDLFLELDLIMWKWFYNDPWNSENIVTKFRRLPRFTCLFPQGWYECRLKIEDIGRFT